MESLHNRQKSEEMVAVGKPPAPKIRSPDIGVPIDIKIVKPVSSSFDIYSLSVQDLGQYLHILNIGQYSLLWVFGRYPCLANLISFRASKRLKPNSSTSIASSSSFRSVPSMCASVVIMSKTNPDPGNSMHEEPVSFYNQYEKDVSMGLPSTQKSEEMVAVGKPPATY
jgi:hypothetical protein